jgi:TPR repeat protein
MYLGQNTDYAHTAAIVSKQSLKWFLKASEHDYPVSVFNVAYLYELDSKLELAARWYRRAEALSCDTKGRYISVACMSLIDIIRLRLADAELASLSLSCCLLLTFFVLQ